MQGLLISDPTSQPRKGCLHIEEDRIIAVELGHTTSSARGTVIDYGEQFLFPGLIDTHCHLCLPGDGTPAEEFLKTAAPDSIVDVGCANARHALSRGITSLRDLGSPQDLAFTVRKRLDLRDTPASRVFVSGAPLTAPGSHLAGFGGVVSHRAEMIQRIKDLAGRGADVIKVIASGSGGPGQQAGLPFSSQDLVCIAEHAHASGLPVTAHVTSPASIEACLNAGFDGLEHVGFWMPDGAVSYGEDLVRRMERAQTFVAPTIQAIYRTWRELPHQTEEDKARRHRTFEDTVDVVRHLSEHDLRFVSGSDAGWLLNPFGDLRLGLQLLVEAGVSLTAALQSATTTAAQALNKAGHLGCLVPAAQADFLVLQQNPLEGVDALDSLTDVYVGGQRVDRSSDQE